MISVVRGTYPILGIFSKREGNIQISVEEIQASAIAESFFYRRELLLPSNLISQHTILLSCDEANVMFIYIYAITGFFYVYSKMAARSNDLSVEKKRNALSNQFAYTYQAETNA